MDKYIIPCPGCLLFTFYTIMHFCLNVSVVIAITSFSFIGVSAFSYIFQLLICSFHITAVYNSLLHSISNV